MSQKRKRRELTIFKQSLSKKIKAKITNNNTLSKCLKINKILKKMTNNSKVAASVVKTNMVRL